MLRAAALATAILLSAARSSGAQTPADEGGWPLVVEHEVRERWIQGEQHPGFMPFTSARESIHLRPRTARGFPDDHFLDIRVGIWEGALRLDQRNRLLSVEIDPPSIHLSGSEIPGLDNVWQRHLANLRDRITGLWEVPVVLPAQPLTSGFTWTDTLAFEVEPGKEWLETLNGIWRHEVVGDTVLAGRRLPVVRTEAEVQHRSFEPVADGAMEGALVIERTMTGALVGMAVVDTALGVRAIGVDSATWDGLATLHTQDDRSFDAPLRYERVRTWRLMDSTTWAAVQDSLRQERERRSTGMLLLPATEIQERLARGDSALVDSLRTRWRETDDANERATVEGLLRRGPGSATDATAWLLRERLELGDTARVLADRLDGGSWLESLTEHDLDELVPYLDDLGRLWDLGVTPRWTYSTLAKGLLDDSPIIEPDTARWNCTPSACERVIALLETASEPRLRDVALVTAFMRDPARWYERVKARADSGSLIARAAVRMGEGVGSTWPASLRDPVPVPATRWSWRDWLAWMGGTVRFEPSHMQALRAYSARTGRDVVGELVQAWPPESDSARLVLGTILRGMGALEPPTLEELAVDLLSGSLSRVAGARRQLAARVPLGRIRGEAPDSLLAPANVVAEVLPPLLDSLMAEGRSPWPGVDHDGAIAPSVALYMGGFHGIRDVPRFLLDENLPPGFVPAPASGFELIDQTAWDARPLREGGVLLTVSPLIARGPFAVLSWMWEAVEHRSPSEAPSGYAGGGAVWLLRTDNGWTVVSGSGWIT